MLFLQILIRLGAGMTDLNPCLSSRGGARGQPGRRRLALPFGTVELKGFVLARLGFHAGNPASRFIPNSNSGLRVEVPLLLGDRVDKDVPYL